MLARSPPSPFPLILAQNHCVVIAIFAILFNNSFVSTAN